ncbi:MAG: hypothetical protein AAB946_02405, partial [Patescibacteria group bacterium]
AAGLRSRTFIVASPEARVSDVLRPVLAVGRPGDGAGGLVPAPHLVLVAEAVLAVRDANESRVCDSEPAVRPAAGDGARGLFPPTHVVPRVLLARRLPRLERRREPRVRD